MLHWVRLYIGIPYLKNGRNKNKGLDCWGLVRLVLSEQFDLNLPSYEVIYDEEDNFSELPTLIDMNKELIKNKKVLTPEIGDIVLVRTRGLLSHIGLYVGDDFVLHIERHKNSIIEKLSSPRINKRIEGYYRVL